MAKVTHFTVHQPEPPLPESVTLLLTGKEAQFLRDVTGWLVTGTGPARAINDSIYSALSDVPGLLSVCHSGISGNLKIV